MMNCLQYLLLPRHNGHKDILYKEVETMTDQGKNRKARICQKIWVESRKVDLHLSVYLGVLPILKEYVMVFQEAKLWCTSCMTSSLRCLSTFLACFIKPEHLKMSPIKLLKLDLAQKNFHSQIYLGKVAEDLVAAQPKHPVVMDFIENVTKAFINCGKYMQDKRPLKSKTLQALSSIDPVVRGYSQMVIQLKELAIIMKHLVPTESDSSMEILRQGFSNYFHAKAPQTALASGQGPPLQTHRQCYKICKETSTFRMFSLTFIQ
ncbi:uncharacterized protein LOC132882166 isoform X1 [Neoarius graeffei]|uniref:uncharacterized protein LOC132882166 isoform X1 n=1 Tax=Neoarius graeffei TaxID=443677 RepID=UPI00298CDA3C|nr:uncharacterized protein LOC132882166 isoform X1 [Neoarius graeffei]